MSTYLCVSLTDHEPPPTSWFSLYQEKRIDWLVDCCLTPRRQYFSEQIKKRELRKPFLICFKNEKKSLKPFFFISPQTLSRQWSNVRVYWISKIGRETLTFSLENEFSVFLLFVSSFSSTVVEPTVSVLPISISSPICYLHMDDGVAAFAAF